ncbi:hypothetical protein [Agromyces sp. SYSU T0242]|uniref:hypothetical protein n=1 Tax=Agromyces litoreus TaxID=3158561 RepID=UPI0033976DF6
MSAALEAMESALWQLDRSLARLSRPLTVVIIVDAWIAGLREAGVKAENARAWSRGSKWATKLPLVIEFPCPYMHRTPDRRDFRRVRLIVEDDGWVSVDPDSPCEKCNDQVLARWLLTCPRCEYGEEGDFHRAGHDMGQKRGRTRSGPGIVGSTSPVSFVLWQFGLLAAMADARWWVERTDEAIAELDGIWPDWLPEHREEFVTQRLARARRLLARTPPPTARSAPTAPAESWTERRTLAWLEQNDIDATLTARAAWARANAIDGHPPKRAVEAALRHAKSGTA